MKTRKTIPAVLLLITSFFLAGGCLNPSFDEPDLGIESGHGLVQVSLRGVNVQPSLGARTMLPLNPEFTRYELEFPNDSREPYSFTNSAIQLQLPAASYTAVANGYNGDVLVARSDSQSFTVSDGNLRLVDFDLKPYIERGVYGVLTYALSWDGLTRMPWRAELSIEYYDPDTSAWGTISPSNIPAGSAPGNILLLSKDAALVNLTGSLSLPPGEYKLTMTVIMDAGTAPVSRFDIAHVYSNLTTAGAFYYGGGDLLTSNASPDSGTSFLTAFTFTETPNATTVIGSEAGSDGKRLVMVMVPPGTDLKRLTPEAVCAPGSVVTSPVPTTLAPGKDTQPSYQQGEIDFTVPTTWTVQAKNGATQQYTVVVSNAAVADQDKMITYFFFRNYADYPGIIDQAGKTIHVTLPYRTDVTKLNPIISIIGQRVDDWDGTTAKIIITPFPAFDFTSPRTFRVYSSADDLAPKAYTVTVAVATDGEAEITKFAIDGYPGVDVDINQGPSAGQGTITAVMPYGVALANLTPLIHYTGKTMDPGSGVAQNFNVPVYYTVTADNGAKKTYQVTLTNAPADTDTGIFDFRITNVPAAKVVIGQKPRADGKIPIVIQAPYGTDEKNLITAITLRSAASTIDPGSGTAVPFGNEGNSQEAVYTVSSQAGTTQDYVVVVSAGGQYLYVNGATGDDTWPDYYTGESPEHPFKTLAYAVKKASEVGSNIDHIFVSGELNAANQTGAKTDPHAFIDSGSLIAINGTGNKKITVTGTDNAILRGTSGKRVLSITGGANLVFENITVTGGNAGTAGDGGGLYIAGNSKVKFSEGSITGNTARSGGGVFVGADNSDKSEFTFAGGASGAISGNTATGTATGVAADGTTWTTSPPSIAGGGGVCVNGNGLFWLASGSVSNNTTAGSGGGALVRGYLAGYAPTDENSGFIMSGGSLTQNKSTGNASPHGGGGVYVASGEFEMAAGEITHNTSSRQGGGVFVHSAAIFAAWGNSSITGNNGTGSSKAICSRGVTSLMGNAQADTIYVWNPSLSDGGVTQNDFTLSGSARAEAIVLAYSPNHLTRIVLAGMDSKTDQISRIDLEGHLTNYKFIDTDINDWLNKTLLEGADAELIKRFSLGTFLGGSALSLSPYKLEVVNGDDGKMVKK